MNISDISHIEVAFSPNKSGSRQKFVLTVVADGRLSRSVCLPGIRPAVRLRRTWFQFSASGSGTFVFVFTRLFKKVPSQRCFYQKLSYHLSKVHDFLPQWHHQIKGNNDVINKISSSLRGAHKASFYRVFLFRPHFMKQTFLQTYIRISLAREIPTTSPFDCLLNKSNHNKVKTLWF